MLYRCDYADGSPVRDRILLGADFLCHHMQTARARAHDAASAASKDVTISSIDGAGRLKARLVIHPDGSASPPPEAKSDCTAKPGGPPCFCRNCRAARRRG